MSLSFLALSALLLLSDEQSQKDRCSPNEKHGPMACINRNGHCLNLVVDGHTTLPLTDKATAKRVHAIKHYEDVCWRLDRPVSGRFRASALAAGLDPKFLGEVQHIDVILLALGDYDPDLDSRLEPLRGIRTEADGYRNGTWQIRSPQPLAAGEYIAVFRVSGTSNWDKQAVLLTVDPSLSPAPADEGRPPQRSGVRDH
jgi:hypothetical protein